MRFRILADGDEESLVDLQSWLATDPGTARLGVATVAGQGPTMGVLEALEIIVGSAVDIGNFALAYVAWRSVRRDAQPPASADSATGGLRLVHGETTVSIGHLTPEELGDLIHRVNNTGGAAGADT